MAPAGVLLLPGAPVSMARALDEALGALVRLATMIAECGEVAVATIRAKSGSFPSIGIMGRLIGLPTVTKKHGGVRTTIRRAVGLLRAHGYDELGQS